jgi:hypothetical protein
MRFERKNPPGGPSCCPESGHRPLTSVRVFGTNPLREKGSEGFSGPFSRTPLALDLLIFKDGLQGIWGDFKGCVPP